jgi:hypothetical protein
MFCAEAASGINAEAAVRATARAERAAGVISFMNKDFLGVRTAQRRRLGMGLRCDAKWAAG